MEFKQDTETKVEVKFVNVYGKEMFSVQSVLFHSNSNLFDHRKPSTVGSSS